VAGLVRPYTKWDAHPGTLEEALVAIQEAYRQAITPPCAPTLVILDSEIQKVEAGDLQVPEYVPPTFTGIDKSQADEIAKGLVESQNPHISVGRLRTHEGVNLAVQLAELAGASVDTQATRGPMSFPQRHALTGPGADENYDYVLGLERPAAQVWISGPRLADVEGRDPTGIGFGWNLFPGARGTPGTATKKLSADAEASIPVIIEALRERMTFSTARSITERTAQHTAANLESRKASLREAVEQKRQGWGSSPISLARLYAELWPLIKDLDWCLASPSMFSSGHHADLWDHDKPYSYLSGYPAAALGYCLGASTGAALAARERNRIVINIQGDGDFNYTPGSLWTAAHHRLPMLTIMHNNRAWHMELMYLTYMAGVRGRGTDRAHIGTTFRNPHISYAKIAEGYGVRAEGPISDPEKLVAALQRGVETVQNGEPYLIDVLTQPR
jgi:thiamine pyrophosphate-dependent acetolactate synthase large subunit-like protein